MIIFKFRTRRHDPCLAVFEMDAAPRTEATQILTGSNMIHDCRNHMKHGDFVRQSDSWELLE